MPIKHSNYFENLIAAINEQVEASNIGRKLVKDSKQAAESYLKKQRRCK